AIRATLDRQLERDVVAVDRAVLERDRAQELVLQRARELACRVDDELEHEQDRTVRRVDVRVPLACDTVLSRERQREERERGGDYEMTTCHGSPCDSCLVLAAPR